MFRRKRTTGSSIFYDADGYFTSLLDDAAAVPAVRLTIPSKLALYQTSLIHYLLRSSMVIPNNADKDVIKALQKHSELCLSVAVRHVPEYSEDAALPPPEWAKQFHQNVRGVLRDRYPQVDNVVLRATLEPRLYARSLPKSGEIYVSALTREYLRTLNLVLWNMIIMIEKNDADIIPSVLSTDLNDIFLSYALSLYRTLSFSRLPMARAYDQDALLNALWSTRVQLTFILAHEYAHVLVHEGCDLGGPELESEADAFALQILDTAIDSFPPQYACKACVWASIGWFYRYLEIERIIGSIVNESAVDWRQELLSLRRQQLVAHIMSRNVDGRDCLAGVTGGIVLQQVIDRFAYAGEEAVREKAARMSQEFELDKMAGMLFSRQKITRRELKQQHGSRSRQ